MNTLSENFAEQRVGEIVAQNYHAAGVLQKYGIDFCCGGGITLAKACEKNEKDVNKVAEELALAITSTKSHGDNYNDWSPSFLIDYIENTHHTFVRRKIEEIGFFAAKVAKVYGETHPENVELYHTFITLSQEMQSHLESEEKIVFPLIKKIQQLREKGEAIPHEVLKEFETQIVQMEDEHEGAGNLMKEIRKLSNDFTPPSDACTTYKILYQNLAGFEQDLHKHVHLENNILFKKAERLLVD